MISPLVYFMIGVTIASVLAIAKGRWIWFDWPEEWASIWRRLDQAYSRIKKEPRHITLDNPFKDPEWLQDKPQE